MKRWPQSGENNKKKIRVNVRAVCRDKKVAVVERWSLVEVRLFIVSRGDPLPTMDCYNSNQLVNVPDIVFIHVLDLPLSPSSFQADISIVYCLPQANVTVKFVAITSVTLIWFQPIPGA